jgi:NTP pyrophosphatase (non-canonical NTP hydrolase)
MEFSDYQKAAHETATTDDSDVYSLGLIGEAGSVASAIKKFKRDAPSRDQVRRDIQEQLGDALWYLAEIATRYDLQLDDVAQLNLTKTSSLFKTVDKNFDDGFLENERFPRTLEITFGDDGSRLELRADGIPIGDPLTDNAYADDGYRYHDAFHIAYMTILGWSPVMRALLRLKRKSNKNIDEVEDGARARALEEGISILVFSQSPPPTSGASLFTDRSQIPFWLLENIKKMTPSLEVRARSVSEWQTSISEGFRIFDQLRANRGGKVVCTLDSRSLTYVKPE